MSTATASVSSRKRAAILDSARETFLRKGFTDANLDDIAALASVSKMTIYSHFGSKDELFRQVIEAIITQRSAAGPPLDAAIPEDELAVSLRAIAADIVRTVRHTDVVGIRRVLIAEQPRHPALAAKWRRSTVVATTIELADYFRGLQERRLLVVGDPNTLAAHFLWMLIGDSLDAGLLDPAEPPTRSPTDVADEVVQTFLRAYGDRHNSSRRTGRKEEDDDDPSRRN